MRTHLERYLWVIAVGLALTFIGLDSTARLRAVWNVTNLRVGASPALKEDSSTLTGYTGNEHRLILPAIGMDGYNWMMQAERMVAGTEGWRVRHADYDHPPSGRNVEWGGFLHWEVAAMAWLGTHLTAIQLPTDSWLEHTRNLMFGPYRAGGLPMSLAIERVAPWTNTVTLVMFILVTAPLVAWRFGSIPASLLALGFAVTYPFYDFFSVGYFDHHGLAATWDLLMVVFLLGAGAGWLRAEGADVSRLGADEQLLWKWLPARSQARWWFVASAVAGGAGLWESAASVVPALIGVGIGALVGTAWLARGLTARSPWRVDPTLWRTWGKAGCAASLFFYLLEYFPGHFGWNLEVNHPLYALAWLGAGDLICRVCEWILRGTPGASAAGWRRAVLVIGADLLMVGALPVTIALTSDYTFATADRFLWSLCEDYILENQSLFRQLAAMGSSEILARVSAAPLLLLPVIALFWNTDLPRAARLFWRALLLISLLPVLVFAHVAFAAVIFHVLQAVKWLPADPAQGESLANLLALGPDLLVLALLVAVPLCAGAPELPRPWKGLLSVAVFPALVLLVLALQQSRWLGLSCAVWLGALLAVASVCVNARLLDRRWLLISLVAATAGVVASPYLSWMSLALVVAVSGGAVLVAAGVRSLPRWSAAPSLAMGLFLALVLVPFPAYTIAQWTRFDLRMPVTQLDLTQVITRDASYRIRQRLGREPGVIVSGPSTTTWMTYFGGFKGLGTLYADNLDGLKAVAAIYSASSAEDALELCKKYGVTHFAIYSWDAFAEEYAKLWRGLRRPDPAPSDAFMLRILQTGNIPSWLRPIPYPVPSQEDLANQWIRLFEVVPDQTVEEATVRAAQYLWAEDKPDAALGQLRPLLAREPDYLPALICLARVEQSVGERDGFRQTTQNIRANLVKAATLSLEDRIDLAVVMALAGDRTQAREQIVASLQSADEKGLRRLLPDTLVNLVGITRQLELTEGYARTYQLAFDLLPPEAQDALSH
jgi:hypothetical protein